MTKDVILLSISVLLLFRHYISHKITFGAPSSGGVLCSACGAFIKHCLYRRGVLEWYLLHICNHCQSVNTKYALKVTLHIHVYNKYQNLICVLIYFIYETD